MHWLPDTNIWIHFLKGRHPRLTDRLLRTDFGQMAYCAPVLAELLMGAHGYGDPTAREKKVRTTLEALVCLPFDEAAAVEYARIRFTLGKQGRLIGNMDMQIAAIALVHDLTVVTHNREEFSRVPGLRVVDWLVEE